MTRIKSITKTNCPLAYECPLSWSDLEGDDRVRHCGECNKDVYWCETKSDYDTHAKAGDCMAFLIVKSNLNILGMTADPYHDN